MNPKEILHALQEREISLEDAKKELAKVTRVDAGNQDQGKKELNGRMEQREAVAIVGMSARYPGADELDQYWDNLVQAKNSVQEIPSSRWNMNEYYDRHPNQQGKLSCKWMGMLDDIAYFDPEFFNIPLVEAESMDPQQRIFLQEAYSAFEDAGYSRRLLSSKKCGVYLGIAGNEYGMMLYKNKAEAMDTTGNSSAITAARIAYYLNLTGPAISVDTACSSSLVAAHLACQALSNREIDMALVGGVSLYLTPDRYISMCAAGMLSPDGQCKAFDNSADGFVPGEGAGALVLKRLSDAEADHDAIYGVIIGSGINQNGNTNGITAPSKNRQIQLEKEIYDKHKVDPDRIGYAEMHGTGTKLGDLIELEALSAVFREKTSRRNYCAIGSVKSNIGHASAAAGIASIQKVLLSMRHKMLVPTLHFQSPNEHFDFNNSPFYVNTKLNSWEAPAGISRQACVSSFGFSGSNAHIVLEEYLAHDGSNSPLPDAKSEAPLLFVLSAKSKKQLRLYTRAMKEFIQSHTELPLADIVYTLQVGREAMDQRIAFFADSREALVANLEECLGEHLPASVLTTQLNKHGASEDELTLFVQKRDWQKIAELWVNGLPLDWDCLYTGPRPGRVHLPTYPFAKEYCWVSELHNEAAGVQNTGGAASSQPGGVNSTVPEIYAFDEPYLQDHKVGGEPVLIGMTHASLAINAFFGAYPSENNVHLHGLHFIKPVEIKKGQHAEIVIESLQSKALADFRVVYRYGHDGKWDVTAKGSLGRSSYEGSMINIGELQSTLEELKGFEHIYCDNPAIQVGDTFKNISRIYAGNDRVLARVDLTQALREDQHAYAMHPLLVYNAFQAVVPLLGRHDMKDGFLPFGINDIFFQKTGRLESFWILVQLRKFSGELLIFDTDVMNDESQVIAHFSGCSSKRLHSKTQDHTGSRSREEGVKPQALSQFGSDTYQPERIAASSQLSGKVQKYLKGKLSSIIPGYSKTSNIEANLMDLGVGSVDFITLTSEIEKEANLKLSPALFFEYPNIKELAAFFSQEHRDAFVQLLEAGSGNPDEPMLVRHTMNTAQEAINRDFSRLEPSYSETFSEPVRDEIAVIGMHGTFAGASDVEQFWNNLRENKDVITEIPMDHWDYLPWYDPSPEAQDKTYCKWGGFIKDIDQFDAEFFNISPREAEWMDPQLRLMLQSIYAAGEDAGWINRLRGTDTGVFIGVCSHDYKDLIAEKNLPVDPYVGIGNSQTILANRISFFLDLKGPSIAIDTACSSSLVAMNDACRALRNNECSMAFVGGANLLLSSWHYRYFSSMGALSPTGRCHTFDEAADGYIPGECVASMLLKPLQQAIKDGDRVYAIVKGSAALHGGYTPSITAPSVAGEENVILKAWEDAGIPPETISYIEAHGTGTKLGDPIEINSLKRAFKHFTGKEGFCAVGSVKANIGHAEGAAGIAGVMKVILQMKHRQIPALPMLNKLNPYIELDKSALYINRELEEWKCSEGTPRRAGVSSFGMSGAYAHVVLEEYIPQEIEQPAVADSSRKRAVVVLSARNEERLKAQAKQLVDYIRNGRVSDRDLPELAYTLQVGREAMEARIGLIVGSITELEEKLQGFVDGSDHIEDMYKATVKHNKENIAAFIDDEDFAAIIDIWSRKGKYEKIVDLWVKGLDYDWNKLYEGSKPRIISLPTYPFAMERYWIPENDIKQREASAWIHPLLHQNTSDLSEQRFSTSFNGQEFFLKDHVVSGLKVLPGVAYLEMARAAIHQATRNLGEEKARVRLQDVVWIRPVVVADEPVQLHIGLHLNDQGQIDYDIYSVPATDGGEAVIHSQGSAVFIPETKSPVLNLRALQAECVQGKLTSGQCYEAFRARGMDYGPAYRGIEEVYIGTEQVLAKLSLPDFLSNTKTQFVMHPSLMDSAFQSFIGLLISSGGDVRHCDRPVMPFAMEELEIFDSCQSTMWALVRYSDGSATGDQLQKTGIDLCDEQGRVCVRMRGVSSRMLEKDLQTGHVSQTDSAENAGSPVIGPVMLAPVWDVVLAEKGHTSPTAADRVVVIGGNEGNREIIKRAYPNIHVLETQYGETIDEIAQRLEGCGWIDHILWIAPYHTIESVAGEACIAEQDQGVFHLFRVIKALLHLGYDTRDLGWSAITVQAQPINKNDAVNPTHASIYGLIGSMAKEYPNWKTRVVDVEAGCDWPIQEMFSLPSDPRGDTWVYRNKEWYRQSLVPMHDIPSGGSMYRRGGVYVVIGGAGGIGEVWSEYVIRNWQAQVVWIGRRKKDTVIQAKLDRLAALGPVPDYIAADASDRQSLQKAYEEIKEKHAQIHGVVHAAIVLLDQSLANMDEDRFRAGLSAKVDVSVRIAQVMQEEPLDFVLFFSSMISFLKSAGQSNYASGCTFKDAFADQLALERDCAVKVMNWGYWGSVGIVASESYQERMAQAGIGSIEPEEALKALEALASAPMNQMAFMKTTKPLVLDGLNEQDWITVCQDGPEIDIRLKQKSDPLAMEMSAWGVRDEIKLVLMKAATELLHVSEEHIDADVRLTEYGFDPIKAAELADRLSEVYGFELSCSAFIEYETLNELAEYLAGEYPNLSARQELDSLLCKLLLGQLQSIGLFTEKETAAADFKANTAISGLYDRWLEESIAVLIQNEYITYDGAVYSVLASTRQLDIKAIWNEWDRKKANWLENPNLKAQVLLLEAMMGALPQILTGKVQPTDLMFPNSSMELVEGIYKNNPSADYYNEVLSDTVAEYMAERIKQDPSAQVRIIEIGAGTGGTTGTVLKKLSKYRKHIQEYCYTDVSRAFLMHAEREYGPGNPYLTYRLFNVEQPLDVQHIEMGKYDLAIAANVLHATKNIRQTLRNAKAVLRKNGLLLMNELISNSLFAHLTFGLLEGWWLYEDPAIRISGCPGLSAQSWKMVLEDEGFHSVFSQIPEAYGFEQQIIAAASDGAVRQQQLPKPELLPAVKKDTELASRAAVPAEEQAVHKIKVKQTGRILPDSLQERSTAYIKKLISDTLKIPAHKIDSSEPLERYGIDSLLVVQLTNTIRKVFKNVSSTLFFEYQTIDALVGYFMNTQRDSLIALAGVEESQLSEEFPEENEIAAMMEAQPPMPLSMPRRGGRFLQSKSAGPEGFGSQASGIQDIAIIGLAGRYAKANNIDELWDNLRTGENCISEIPKDRWDWKQYYHEEKGKKGYIYSKWGGFIEDIDKFDPLFFKISPAEAERMDPQERLFLEVVYACMEDAGYTPLNVCESRKVGVYAGVMNANYPTGASYWSIANRISYLFNFQGPSMAVDTACSSSLTAVHLALESLYSGMSECAIAGGVNLVLDPTHYMKLASMTMLSPGEHCKAFGAQADGFVDGEGVGAILLKPLVKAIADGDHIYGIIKGSALNAGGKTNGYTVPNPNAQFQLVADALKRAKVHPRTVSYLEAHGTGTELGDPIEIAGLTRAYEKDTEEKQFCAIGSVKSNIGHCESAAGIAGMTKVLLQLKNRQLAPSLHSKVLNPNIEFGNTPFIVQQELAEWKRPVVRIDGVVREYPRIAGISSFGAGGANAHIVIEEYIPQHRERTYMESAVRNPAILILSAKNEERLKEKADQLLAAIGKQTFTDEDLADIAYTLQVGREAMEERLAMTAGSLKELTDKLKSFLDGRNDANGLYRGQIKGNKDALAVFATDEELQAAIGKWVEYKKYDKLLDLWVKGLAFDWNRLYGEDAKKPCRISLPTYPFTRERYWTARSLAKSGGHEVASDSEPSVSIQAPAAPGKLMLQPCWQEKAAFHEAAAPSYEKVLVMLCEPCGISPEGIAERMDGVRCISLQSEKKGMDERFQDYTLQAFREIRSLIEGRPQGKVLIQVVIPGQEENQVCFGLSGLLRTASLENPKLVGQIIGIEENDEGVAEKLLENSRWPSDHKISYRNGRRYVAGWNEVEVAGNAAAVPWKEQGVYLITGGAGALGLLFARDIGAKVKDAILVLTGRSPIGPEITARLEDLETLGARVEYRQTDIAKKEEVARLIRDIIDKYGRLDGIIHSAGVIRDSFILKKDDDEIRQVLAPKVTGLVNLDQASKELPLDFFILFSSGTGAWGNVGQADYSAANAFMDAYAGYRNRLASSGQRRGKTLSINWPLWSQGGMQISEATKKIMRQEMGMVPMETSNGIRALYQGLAAGEDQVLVFEGDVSKLWEHIHEESPKADPKPGNGTDRPMEQGILQEKILHKLKVIFGEITKLSVSRIDADEPLENYGIDSVMIMQLNHKLSVYFGDLSKTLFFEYKTLQALAEYLITAYSQECVRWAGLIKSAGPLEKESLGHYAAIQSPSGIPAEEVREQAPSFSAAQSEISREPIAIIGISGRYPQANNLKDYWENLQAGKDCITEISQERWPLEGFYHPDAQEAVAQGKSYSKWGGFVDGFADFDPLFFNISPREAINIDPQERLFMESCWEALEDAGYTREQLAVQYNRRVGVFAGITKTGFDLYGAELWKQGKRLYPHTSFGSVANRISYLLDIQGPSMPIDTMCSASLTAIHEACEHLYHGDCEMAIAGGVNLYLHPSNYVLLCAQKMLSSDGRCKSFGQGANGFVPGEGVGVVLLKPLSRAVKEGDHIYAVIRGTSINHGGKTNGYTVPNPNAQGELIRAALDKAGVNARTVSYIEAHGTGTELGDPIEITGLTQAFRKDTQHTGFCAIGSVKSNIGHLEAAAGIAGITKIVLQMKHQKLVPSLHAKQLNDNISFAKTPFAVQRELSEWKRPMIELNGTTVECPRIAGVSSFGAGGANAHVIIEEYIPDEAKKPQIAVSTQSPAVIVLSARSEDRLKAQAKQLLDIIGGKKTADASLADIAYTLQVGREAMEERLACIVGSIKELEEKLGGFVAGQDSIEGLYRGQAKRNKETVALFAADEDLQRAVEAWLGKRKYGRLLELWVKGLSFDWNKLYGNVKPQRISLPAYPFARERYWIPASGAVISPRTEVSLMETDVNRTLADLNIPASTAKPSLISLQSLSGDQKPAKGPEAESRPSITLSLPSTSLWQQVKDHETAVPIAAKEAGWADHLEEELAASLADILSMRRSDVDRDKSFMDIGLDSITGVEWIQAINKRYGLSITATRIYDYPNLRGFLEFLEKELDKQDIATADRTENVVSSMPQVKPGGLLSLGYMQEELTESLAEILSMKRSDVDLDAKFTDMGLDSIIGVEWIQMINKQYGLSIAAMRLYDYPTIREFCEYLKKELDKSGEDLSQASLQPASSLSLHELIQNVQQGNLDIDLAERLFHQSK
ncbi:SDR family NAD(P)-dependent oxidoreductase [Paenibacillus sp. HN-1]|uniref:SDR family NAD(P)-dependent oxidoreductase n=1 Tax=Paenibacillus TaxID=44249 RepID=UPI001CA94D66|nr:MULTISPECIES: SDR family NAD(P)-dependent oxidoreductase [Paenibacillus]MBY9081324.1 SDR family NAD(P)-dependent oxidoreductase [Paenibacillus sp. CGMCC 1.18879]MBY9086491.1 SDR family NAD(P)-dependent oxidoreductase [Paenibacillus sinensis]